MRDNGRIVSGGGTFETARWIEPLMGKVSTLIGGTYGAGVFILSKSKRSSVENGAE